MSDRFRFSSKVAIALAGVFLLGAAPAFAELPKPRKMDLDGDGVKESVVYFSEGLARRAEVDRDLDGIPDGFISYRNGHRESARIDADFDGRFETTVEYYFTGVPAAIRVDKDRDGKVDTARFFKNGFLYKREWDRNGDGKADFRVLYEMGPDLRPAEAGGYQRITKQYDDDHDGVFDRSVDTRRRSWLRKAPLIAGSTASVGVR